MTFHFTKKIIECKEIVTTVHFVPGEPSTVGSVSDISLSRQFTRVCSFFSDLVGKKSVGKLVQLLQLSAFVKQASQKSSPINYNGHLEFDRVFYMQNQETNMQRFVT